MGVVIWGKGIPKVHINIRLWELSSGKVKEAY
jgi:hypothetical protein